LNLSDKGSVGTKVFEGKGSAEKEGSGEKGGCTADPVTTVGDTVTIASIDIDAAGPSTTSNEGVIRDDMMTMAETLMAIRN
ncbi:hypothetical protein Tco_0632215, partial [Tanacetum coccineum]